MWTFFTGIIPLVSTIFNAFVSKSADKAEIGKQWAKMTMAFRSGNQAADDRKDSLEQEARIDELKKGQQNDN